MTTTKVYKACQVPAKLPPLAPPLVFFYHSTLLISQFLPGLPARNLEDEFLVERERRFHLLFLIDHVFDCCRRVLCRHTFIIRLQR